MAFDGVKNPHTHDEEGHILSTLNKTNDLMVERGITVILIEVDYDDDEEYEFILMQEQYVNT